MTNELTIQQSTELTIAKQENEILKLKLELEKTQAQKLSKLEDSLFSPKLFAHYKGVAEYLATTTMVPKNYIGKPGDIFVAMAMGYKLGLPIEQSLQDIAVINGRPCLWGDGLLSLVLNHPELESIEDEPILDKQTIIGYICTVKRRGHEPHSKKFTLQDAQKAGLLGKAGPWTQFPERMLQLRARSFAVRDKFADALRGLRIAEIEKDDEQFIEGEIVIDKGEKQVEKLKKLLQSKIVPEAKEEIKESEEKVSADILNQIVHVMNKKNLSQERRKAALAYYKVERLDHLSEENGQKFLEQLNKINDEQLEKS